jgi:hypothetical protein
MTSSLVRFGQDQICISEEKHGILEEGLGVLP